MENFNPSNPDMFIYILHTVLCVFLIVLKWRICSPSYQETHFLHSHDLRQLLPINNLSDHRCLISVQVNNAGIVIPGTIETTTLEDFDKVMRINMR